MQANNQWRFSQIGKFKQLTGMETILDQPMPNLH